MKIYNGEGMILGRLAAAVAKDALLGEEVKVVNCEKIIVSGRKTNTFAAAKQRYERRGYPPKSANPSRLPERHVRRAIRGMLPWKRARGKEAFKRVLCYRGVPGEFSDAFANAVSVEKAAAAKLPTLRQTTIREICAHLGWKR